LLQMLNTEQNRVETDAISVRQRRQPGFDMSKDANASAQSDFTTASMPKLHH
jgi:hypothetical protein